MIFKLPGYPFTFFGHCSVGMGFRASHVFGKWHPTELHVQFYCGTFEWQNDIFGVCFTLEDNTVVSYCVDRNKTQEYCLEGNFSISNKQ